ncbi:UDP-N-acetylmuramoyl-tripeptide--D-alanyl-D-alanine ligase [Rickettsia endosymbiont of Culicoides newsteadi]|uniref:UDP-N-acetylmuramoyl-tripeptide--D-alanyl-D- alanine ligase n=1 Tax=Rickettsia endosymbiont of Culicoides newsteadi TaxID=1961830 RepID=UPI000B9C00DA|nr:UDP-N-acetylmuramoyl-tripeptide--D-alanyl-D-alanine ligase [Rickettsia endosymbiont of Culicoides newsteadi]OZG31449.1 UDP-N-acetylmuramoyl-tripeptide--D-alanyl-D- alanine ligase [Rickettsia endosymbiont of Culicoides newsteadi]
MIWSARDLNNALNIEVHPDIHGGQVQFNSNSVTDGDLFIVLKGANDGHNYALHALERGANAVIISQEITGLPDEKVIMVPDTLTALHQMAEYKRQKSQAKFIGVTGSSGKTGTKEAIKTVLSHFGSTFASRGNFNNHLGVPINLASLPDDIEYAVFEMGMNHPGEIRTLTKMVRPDISVITTISEAHLEFFQSQLHLVDAKCEIFEGMSKDGIAVIDLDSPYYNRVLQNLKQLSINNIYSFGTSPYADCSLISYEYQQITQQVRLRYSIHNTKIDIEIPLVPEHYARNYTIALQMSAILNLDINVAARQLSKILLMDGRGKLINAKYHGQDYQIICDYYNANPESVKAALLYLKQLSGKKKIAIIGDMLELGDNSIKFHKDLIPAILDSGANRVFLVGNNTQYIYQSLPDEIEKIHFDNVDLLIENLSKLLKGNELILIKGSNSTQLSKIIQSFELH